MTGDEHLDLAIEAGPRVVTPDMPEDALRQIARGKPFSSLRDALKAMKLESRARCIAAIMRTCWENRQLENLQQATRCFIPDARIPIELVRELEAENKELWNPDMREDTLKCYPGLRLKVKFGIKGQEYAGTG